MTFDLQNCRMIDISIALTRETIIYPNNPKIEIETFKNPSGLSYLSKITFGVHSGTHVDAPAHVFKSGLKIDQLPIGAFVGPCRVLDLTDCEKSIGKKDLAGQKIKKGQRLLLKTQNSGRGFQKFYDDYVFVSGTAAGYLAERGAALVGIDYLSIKERGSPDNTPHTEILEKNIPILEGIDLSSVAPGEYFLIALPLKFVGIEAAPARAILLEPPARQF